MLSSTGPSTSKLGPLARVALVRCDDVHGVLCVAAHHIVWDGLSTDVFAREMSSCYASCSTGRCRDATETRASFLDVAAASRRWTECCSGDRPCTGGRQNLTPLPDPLVLPSELTPAVGGSRRSAVSSVLDHELTARIHQISRAEHATPFMTMFAAFTALLFRLTGQKDMTVAVPVSGRTEPDTERMIGLFVQTLPIRVSVRPDGVFL